jgi:2-oxoglutarate dehydrogenase E1 component
MERFDFVNRANAEYIDRIYEQYRRDPRSVDETWRAYFAGFEFAASRNGNGRAAPIALAPSSRAGAGAAAAISRAAGEAVAPLTIGIHNLVHSYRELGHFVARLDPLGHDRPNHPLLELSNFSISPADLDREVGTGGFLGQTDGTLRDLIERLRATYCGTLGVEYMDISDKTQRDWLVQRMEPIFNHPQFTPEEQQAILYQLVAAEEFERFLHVRQQGAKRFSIEGAESVIPLINTIVDTGAALGVEEVCMGMAHRGRLNVLAHVLNKPYEVIFSEFKGTIPTEESQGDGDVKYHLGYANDRPAPDNKSIHISLSPNPSHLELVNPVVEGIVRSKQSTRKDKDRSRVVPLLVHGDAAFTGQGIVFETLNLSELPGFRTGGTIHLIINNQIGFTTPPSQSRFTPYPTDVARMIQAPIFHVNGDDPEACVWAAKLAIAFREQFKCDVMIDLWCYRKHGHNEQDEPGFTQPVMYREIAAHKSPREQYAERLIREGRLTQAQYDEMVKVARDRMETAIKQAEEYRPRARTAAMNKLWKGLLGKPNDWSAKTAVTRDVLTKVAETTARVPADFTPHPKLKRLMAERLEAVKSGSGIDWGCGEMLALGSLLLEGTHVRFTGQDAQRGTFSHRHAVLHDHNTGEIYVPLNHLGHGQAYITILNTMLSELAVVGFEYGYSSANPTNLVIWEAQFGDFVNGAQPIIDQFLVASESKWGLMNGLVMYLPHGFEGQGPEHSNAYLERFLSLCAENNIQVVVPTTPAQVFHALRRQIHRAFRKPLIMMMPKSLLRLRAALSSIGEFTEGSMQLVIDDPNAPERDKVRRVLLCTGKLYYSLAATRDKEGVRDTAILRVEQLYPFPKKELQTLLTKYRAAREYGWVQEEPQNRGAWGFMSDHLRGMLPDPAVLQYFGRDEAASPATGSPKMHEVEEREILAHALDLPARKAEAAKGSNGAHGATAKPGGGDGQHSAAVRAVAAAEPATASGPAPSD